jgi:hypothetical protein
MDKILALAILIPFVVIGIAGIGLEDKWSPTRDNRFLACIKRGLVRIAMVSIVVALFVLAVWSIITIGGMNG